MSDTNEEARKPENDAPHSAHVILKDPEFIAMAKKKTAVSLTMTLVIFVVYFGYMGLLATNSPILSQPAVGAATLGIPFGIGVIVLACLLTGVYVVWANNSYDKMVASLKNKMK